MKRMRIMSLVLALLTILSLVGCAGAAVPTETEYIPDYTLLDGKTDLMALTLEQAGYRRFGPFTPMRRGAGTFQDYSLLHTQPLDAADYALGLRKFSEQIEPDTTGLSEFAAGVTEHYGFRTVFPAPATGQGTFEEAMAALFRAAGQGEVSADALALGKKLTKAAKTALTDYLWAAAAAFEQNRQACPGTFPAEWEALAAFCMTAPATEDISGIRTAYIAWKKVDEAALLASGQQLIAATAKLARELSSLQKLTRSGAAVTAETPAGRIIIGSAGDDRYRDTKAFLHIEPGGNDTYEGSVAASFSTDHPISVLLDLGGSDTYLAGEGCGPTQGCGILGTGLFFDLAGDDRYEANQLAQGAAHVGTGALFDAGGNDSYTADTSCQGSATYGFALNIDTAGDDRYFARGYAQAYAGNRGMAFLVNRQGTDEYTVAPFVEEGWEKLAYDQFPKVVGNWSQGCGAGNRSFDPEGKRGLSGGVAALIDLGQGSDHYTGGIWVMGVGYWSGVGLLLDSGGADTYDSQYYCQGSVAHCGAGLMLDMGDGNDSHIMLRKNGVDGGHGAALGFVWDHGTALFINESGNDTYAARTASCGVSWAAYDAAGPEKQNGSYAIFLDGGGRDTYPQLQEPAYGYGRGGFFLDLAEMDTYGQRGRRNGKTVFDDTTRGGVFLDHKQASDEAVGIAFFWEEAKIKHGYWKENLE